MFSNVPFQARRRQFATQRELFVEVELTESLELANEMNLYAYDAYLLRCATKYRLPLLTLDGRLAEAAREKKIQVLEVEE